MVGRLSLAPLPEICCAEQGTEGEGEFMYRIGPQDQSTCRGKPGESKESRRQGLNASNFLLSPVVNRSTVGRFHKLKRRVVTLLSRDHSV